MLNNIIAFSVRHKLLIGLFIIVLISFGMYEATKLPIDAVPDITNNQVQIITQAPSFGATDIERLVTFPVEQANSNIPGIKEIRSFSRFGLSLVTIVFEDNIDVYWARQQVAERLQLVRSEIPEGIGNPELGPITTGLGEIYQYVVKPKKGYENIYSATELRTIQDWVIRRQLLGVEGIAEVSSFGGKLKQYEVALNPKQLNAYHLTISDVFEALANNNQNTGGAYIEKGPTVLYIRSEGLITNKETIENISISHNNGTPICIKDIAEVTVGYATRYGALGYNNEGEVAGAVVMMLKGANSSEVIKAIKERIDQIRKTLPEGVEIEPFLDRTKMVNNAISTVVKNLLEGALIVIFVLVIFLGNLRAGLLVASVIPLSMLFAIILMNIFGVSGNLMSLGALDFGLIIDGAVIIVEAVMHQLFHSKKYKNIMQLQQVEMDAEVINAAGKMMNSAVFGQIIILIVYLPIFTLQGIEGKMFKPMAQTVAFALLGAFILSLTYIPMMSSLVLSKKLNHNKNFSDRIMEKIERGYQHLLSKLLSYPKTILAGVTVLFLISILIFSQLGGEFIPALEEGDFAVDTRVLTGSNINTTLEFTQKAAKILKERFPEVEKVVTKIGSGEVPTDPMPMEASDMMVILKDKKDWTSAKTFDELAEKMSKELQDIPGITAGFQYPVQMRFNELMTGARQDVVCKIFGENLDTLALYAEKLGIIVNKVDGSQNLYVEKATGLPQLIITYNRPMIAQYGMSIAEINRIVNMALAGQSAGLVFEDEKRFNLVVRLSDDTRKNLQDIQNILIPTSMGNQIPLSHVADVAIKDGPNQIQREDAKRRIVVGFNVRNKDVQTVVQDLQNKVAQQLKLPAGYYVTYGGAFENLNQAKARLQIAVPISLLLILILLYFAFNSLKQGLLIYTAIPLSAIGGILFLALRGMPFSISAGIGFIALFGVAVLNGIVLIAEFNQLKKEGWKDTRRIVLMGTKVRLRPVLMTAFVASLGFLPMAISNGSGAEVQRPLATVVIGGLMIATFLTLFVLPILYVFIENGFSFRSKHPITIILLCFLMSNNIYGQKSISLMDAISTAEKNNPLLALDQAKSDYAKALINTYKEIPKTTLSSEFGQFNSIFFDTKIGISQSFSMPKVYKAQSQWAQQEWENTMLDIQHDRHKLSEIITQIFYEYQIIQQKIMLYHREDTLFDNLLQRANIRLKFGETNILELNAAQLQKASIFEQISALKADSTLLVAQLNILLDDKEKYIPMEMSLRYVSPDKIDSLDIDNLYIIRRLEQEKKSAEMKQKMEIAKLSPDMTIGINNMSIKGTGANDKYYNYGYRFTSGYFAVDIPFFKKSQKQKISSYDMLTQSIDKQKEVEVNAIQQQLEEWKILYYHHQSQMNDIEKNRLSYAKSIENAALQQLINGEINYLEWTLLMQQSLSVQRAYFDHLQAANHYAIKIYYLTHQN